MPSQAPRNICNTTKKGSESNGYQSCVLNVPPLHLESSTQKSESDPFLQKPTLQFESPEGKEGNCFQRQCLIDANRCKVNLFERKQAHKAR